MNPYTTSKAWKGEEFGMLRSVLIVVLVLYASLARAETVVFGLTIGKPLSVAECPKYSLVGGRYEYQAPSTAPCAKEFRPKATPMNLADLWVIEFPSSQRPALAQNNLVEPVMVDGILEGVQIWTAGNLNQEAVYRDLVAKFGEPTKKELVSKTNAYGAVVQSVNANWDQGDALQVIFVGIDERIDQGRLFVATKRGLQAHIDKLKRSSTSGRTPL